MSLIAFIEVAPSAKKFDCLFICGKSSISHHSVDNLSSTEAYVRREAAVFICESPCSTAFTSLTISMLDHSHWTESGNYEADVTISEVTGMSDISDSHELALAISFIKTTG